MTASICVAKEAEKFLSSVYHASGQGVEKVIDLVFDYVDKLCWDGNFQQLDVILASANEDRLGKTLSCSLLTISCCVRIKLPSWEPFRNRCAKRWPCRRLWDFPTERLLADANKE